MATPLGRNNTEERVFISSIEAKLHYSFGAGAQTNKCEISHPTIFRAS